MISSVTAMITLNQQTRAVSNTIAPNDPLFMTVKGHRPPCTNPLLKAITCLKPWASRSQQRKHIWHSSWTSNGQHFKACSGQNPAPWLWSWTMKFWLHRGLERRSNYPWELSARGKDTQINSHRGRGVCLREDCEPSVGKGALATNPETSCWGSVYQNSFSKSELCWGKEKSG